MSEKTKSYELQIPERVFEQLYSKADILYFLISAEDTVSSCNTTALEVLDYEKRVLSGKKFLELTDDSCRNEVKTALDNCKKKGYLRDVEACLKSANGRRVHVIINGLSVINDSGELCEIRLYLKNITELMQLKQKQQLSLRIFELLNEDLLFEKLLEKVLSEIQKDMKGDGIGLFLEENSGKKLMLGKWKRTNSTSETEIDDFRKWSIDIWRQMADSCSQEPLCHCTDRGSILIDSISNLLLEMASGDEKDYLISLADYESVAIIPLKTKRFKYGYLVIANSISDCWQSEEIRYLESIFPAVLTKFNKPASVSVVNVDPLNLLLNVSLFGIIFVKDGIIQKTNHWIEKFVDLSGDLIAGRPFTDFIAPEYHESINHLTNLDESDKEQNHKMEIVIIAKDGKRRWVECNLLDIGSDDDFSIWCWISKEEREKLQEQLIQARKMESLGILAGGIVHDFNNLLAAILGHSSLLHEDIPRDSSYYDDVQQIMRTSEKATELTSRLLAYAQGGANSTNVLNLNQLVKEVAGILSRTLDKMIIIRAELDSELASIQGDPSQIQHAILEVTLNARDAMPNGGKVVFRTSHIQLNESDVRLRSGAKPGQYVQLTISDTGIGISSEMKEQMFEPYFTTKPKDAGRGLGLSMVQEIIERHGGFISVFSEINKGTVFKIHFPVCEKRQRKMQSAAKIETKPVLGKETILLVDDEKVLKETARKMLTRYGYKVICAENGTEAIAIYKKYRKRVSLVILDLIMPGMETSKILTWFKKLNPNVKIIAAAGLGEEEVYEKAGKAHLAGFIQKPYQVRPLLQQVRDVLNA